jgi:hypothetical protein
MIVNSPLSEIKWFFRVVNEVTIRVHRKSKNPGWESKWALDVIHSVMEHYSEERSKAQNAPSFAFDLFLVMRTFGLTAW